MLYLENMTNENTFTMSYHAILILKYNADPLKKIGNIYVS